MAYFYLTIHYKKIRYKPSLGLAFQRIFCFSYSKAMGTNDPRVGPCFTPGREWTNLFSALHNIAEYKTYTIWFLVVSMVSEKMIFKVFPTMVNNQIPRVLPV